ncbi:hypothetical protein [Pararobbsia alpina]|uniref:Phage tail protein n=1 Tax=Pararobbsia alpina TaxID=621374 RepID=A0A6S7D481_9BURK|nr:hypothetical protein [Pararobbsia alpina]CAB3795499.1 hypothetical protein LMG28138_03892 [Pararobbsia alpina]
MNKEQIFAALAAEVRELEVKALGAVVRFQKFSGKARDEFFAAVRDGDKSTSNFEASIVAATVVDETGAPVFSREDLDGLRAINADALTELAMHSLSVNKIGGDAEAAAAKN